MSSFELEDRPCHFPRSSEVTAVKITSIIYRQILYEMIDLCLQGERKKKGERSGRKRGMGEGRKEDRGREGKEEGKRGNLVQFSSVAQSCLTLCDPMD